MRSKAACSAYLMPTALIQVRQTSRDDSILNRNLRSLVAKMSLHPSHPIT